MLVLIAAAVIPALLLLLKIYRLDRLEPEPPLLLLSLVLLGVLATAIAAFFENVGEALLDALFEEHDRLWDVLEYFLVVGLSEEGCKYLLLRWRTWRHPAFNCEFDGVVYAVFVSLGFALWENIGYTLAYGIEVAIARALTAVPGHACFGVMMGVWFGIAKRLELDGRKAASRHARRLTLLLPLLLHGLYDYLVLSGDGDPLAAPFLIFAAALFFLSYRLAVRAARKDRYLVSPNWF